VGKCSSLLGLVISDEEKRIMQLTPGVNVIKLFSFITDDKAKYARVFVTGNHFPVWGLYYKTYYGRNLRCP
jgi:hypothetical protein